MVVDYFGDIIVNDISGGEYDGDMIQYSAKQKLPYICMHMQGTPQTMQKNPQYEDVVTEVLAFFKEKIKEAESIVNYYKQTVLNYDYKTPCIYIDRAKDFLEKANM